MHLGLQILNLLLEVPNHDRNVFVFRVADLDIVQIVEILRIVDLLSLFNAFGSCTFEINEIRRILCEIRVLLKKVVEIPDTRINLVVGVLLPERDLGLIIELRGICLIFEVFGELLV